MVLFDTFLSKLKWEIYKFYSFFGNVAVCKFDKLDLEGFNLGLINDALLFECKG